MTGAALGVTVLALGAVVVVFTAGWLSGRLARRDRRRDLADLQATLDRVNRDHAAHDEQLRATAPFPVGPGYIAMSEISAGWDAIERQQRGRPASDSEVSS